jgi:ubiquitin thioesterase protein OTUB1
MRAPVLAPAGFNHHQHQHTGHHQHGRSQNHNQNQHHNLSTMADPYMASDEQMAHLQKLSSEYEPEATVSLLCLGGMTIADRHQGPLVGERQSSAAITTEYANADPIYRVKTAALPGKYAYFRTCRGDGHCGWRGESSAPSWCLFPALTTATAIAFTYFEGLLRMGDVNKFDDEQARLISMGNLLDHIGYSRDIWIDFAEGAFDLLRKLADSVQAMDGAAADILLQTFNDFNESMSIITYVKVRVCRLIISDIDWLV